MPLSSAVRGSLTPYTKSSNDDDISTNPASDPGARNIQRGNVCASSLSSLPAPPQRPGRLHPPDACPDQAAAAVYGLPRLLL
jgi:hypothetical protein